MSLIHDQRAFLRVSLFNKSFIQIIQNIRNENGDINKKNSPRIRKSERYFTNHDDRTLRRIGNQNSRTYFLQCY